MFEMLLSLLSKK